MALLKTRFWMMVGVTSLGCLLNCRAFPFSARGPEPILSFHDLPPLYISGQPTELDHLPNHTLNISHKPLAH